MRLVSRKWHKKNLIHSLLDRPDLRNNTYLWLVVLGIIFALPSVQKFLEWRDSRRPSITLEDVKRLIEESKSEARGA